MLRTKFTRLLLALALPLSLSGCFDELLSPEVSCPGRYTLVGMNDKPLPFTAYTGVEVRSGSMNVRDDNTWSSQLRTSAGTKPGEGTYTVNGATIEFFHEGRSNGTGICSDDELLLTSGSWTYRFRKS